jgi:hypothetical protein
MGAFVIRDTFQLPFLVSNSLDTSAMRMFITEVLSLRVLNLLLSNPILISKSSTSFQHGVAFTHGITSPPHLKVGDSKSESS